MDILIQLQRASWRGIEFPVASGEFGFQQSQSETSFIFVDKSLIESLGQKNPTWRYTIPFREDIAKGPWKNLFVDVYPKFLAACVDRTRGELIDPIDGFKPAKCVSVRRTLSPQRRDGVDLEVEFIEAPPEKPETAVRVPKTLQGAVGMAGAFDKALRKVNKQFQKPPPEPKNSPLDALSSVTDQVAVGIGKVTATFADAAFRVEKSVTSLENLKSASVAPTMLQAKRLQFAILDLEAKNDPTGTRPLGRLSTGVDYTVAALSMKLGMAIQDLIRLNPFLARTPLVKAGTEIRVFATTLSPDGAARAQ